MRQEAKNWWRQAEADLVTAKKLLEVGRWYAVAFFSQQAAEKALKALYIHKRKRLPLGHNIVDLSHALAAPLSVLAAARDLNPNYTVARYPDAANGVPEEMYDARKAEECLKHAKRVLAWVRKSLK